MLGAMAEVEVGGRRRLAQVAFFCAIAMVVLGVGLLTVHLIGVAASSAGPGAGAPWLRTPQVILSSLRQLVSMLAFGVGAVLLVIARSKSGQRGGLYLTAGVLLQWAWLLIVYRVLFGSRRGGAFVSFAAVDLAVTLVQFGLFYLALRALGRALDLTWVRDSTTGD